MLITIGILSVLCLYLVFEIVYVRKMHNYMVDRYDGLVDLSNNLVKESNCLSKDYEEALREHLELLTLTQQLLTSNSVDEVEKIADKICVLIETGVSRKGGNE